MVFSTVGFVMNLLTALLVFGVSAAVVVVAGTFLTRFTDQIAELTGIGRTLAGLILLAMATSLPELTIGANAALMGAVDLTAGDLLGSCLMNLLIFAILDLTHYSRGKMFSTAAAAHALGGAGTILLATVALLFLLLRPEVSLFGRIGLETPALLVGYGFCLRLLYLQQKGSGAGTEASEENKPSGDHSLPRASIGYLLSAGAIFAAAPFLARSADNLAEITGLGGTFIGTTVVAISTSLPEISTTLSAVRRGAINMAIGNIFGSNTFNIVILAFVDLFQPGPLFAALSPTHSVTAVWVILVTAVVIIGQLSHAESRYWLLEPDATLVLLLILTGLTVVYFQG